MARVLVPLPDRDFDVTEVAVPWKLLTEAGHEVVFATEKGAKPAADPRLLEGVLFGQLGAEAEPKAFYRELEAAPAFTRPIAWADVDPGAYGAMLLPGGHAPGMRQYLEGETLFQRVAAFAKSGKPLGAICHGVLVLARAKDDATGKSVLAARRTTCLPKYMEKTAWMLTGWKLGSYYRTYPEYVEDEVKRALDDAAKQFERGPRVLTKKGTREDDSAAFVVEDGSYLSARWPGDAYLFGKKLIARLDGRAPG
ncbi:MAG TPA: type 1 glutamine amidotransferase domain-containing protein [Polyangiaceae bacterium]|jgi:putative intracellular protease/amidase